MKKIILTESQERRLRQYILEMRLRTYIFDWDDNILYMPTKIKMDRKIRGKWVPVDVSTEEFAHIRNNPEYRVRNNDRDLAFEDFQKSEPFYADIKKAINSHSFAPSFEKFKESLIHGNPFGINTARGHKPETLKNGVKLFIDLVLTDSEKSEMMSNLKRNLNRSEGLTDNQLIDKYLDDLGEYYPVSSEEFGERFGLPVKGDASNPEHAKQVAIEHFVRKVFSNIEKLIAGGYTKMSVGFSDDDIRNVKAVERFIEEQLSVMYPEITFVVYDTSERGNRKMVFEIE